MRHFLPPLFTRFSAAGSCAPTAPLCHVTPEESDLFLLRYFPEPKVDSIKHLKGESMSKTHWMGLVVAVVCWLSCAGSLSAQNLEATVLFRQNSDANYSAVVPGYSKSTPDGYVDCAADESNPDCSAPANPGDVSYRVVGTTVSLLLPDGKVAVVNCVNKYYPYGNTISRRNCGMPLVEHVQAEFKGQIAKLKWPVGPDGKTESETYTVIALLDKR